MFISCYEYSIQTIFTFQLPNTFESPAFHWKFWPSSALSCRVLCCCRRGTQTNEVYLAKNWSPDSSPFSIEFGWGTQKSYVSTRHFVLILLKFQTLSTESLPWITCDINWLNHYLPLYPCNHHLWKSDARGWQETCIFFLRPNFVMHCTMFGNRITRSAYLKGKWPKRYNVTGQKSIFSLFRFFEKFCNFFEKSVRFSAFIRWKLIFLFFKKVQILMTFSIRPVSQ